MTIRQILTEGKRLLSLPCEEALIDTPSLDADLLLAETLKTNREKLIANGNETIADDDGEKFFELLKRRRSGECIAYILGRREFRGLMFTVNPAVLVPRPDTEMLVEAALEFIDLRQKAVSSDQKQISLLDLCTGSGAVAISLKNERPFISAAASDISGEALKAAKLNGEKSAQETVFIQSDLFENICGKFDIIVSNPPYVPSGEMASLAPEIKREPAIALDGGKDGLDFIKKIIQAAPEHLFPQGALILEAGSEQIPHIAVLLENQGFIKIKVFKDLSGSERVISGLKF